MKLNLLSSETDQGLIADEEEIENVSVEMLDESDKAKASTTLAQAALEQIEIHGVQSGVSSCFYYGLVQCFSTGVLRLNQNRVVKTFIILH